MTSAAMRTTPKPRLTRTHGGRTVHWHTCPSARTGTPWQWAAQHNLTTVRTMVNTYGMHTCRRCEPLRRLELEP